MKVAKVMVLVGGFVGLFGLDRPLLEVDSAENGFTLSISALRGVYFTADDEVKSRLRESGFSGSVEDELQRSFEAHPAFVHSRRAEAYVMTLAIRESKSDSNKKKGDKKKSDKKRKRGAALLVVTEH